MKKTSSKKDDSVLIVAFDGLDRKLVEKFDLKHIKQEESGKIDNDTGINKRSTGELFASFITGELSDVHGIEGMDAWKKRSGKFIDKILPEKRVNTIRGFHRLKQTVATILNDEHRFPGREFLETDTMFHFIENSKALFVPAFNPSPFFVESSHHKFADLSEENKDFVYYWDQYEYSVRKKELFRTINTYYDLCMVHFHRVDIHQHMYGDPCLSTYNEERLADLYEETEELAEKILDYFSESYETIIFMSDHGRPDEEEHNKEAFYSSSEELFGERIPHITDFHDEILELIEE